jgi:hypothetical protein
VGALNARSLRGTKVNGTRIAAEIQNCGGVPANPHALKPQFSAKRSKVLVRSGTCFLSELQYDG